MVKFVKRYTTLPFLLYMLSIKELTMLSPDSWDDKNDSYFMQQCKDRKQYKSVRVLCLTEASETYHHWKVFADGTSGVCIEFDKEKLTSWVTNVSGLRTGSVKYLTLKALRAASPEPYDLPLLKRYAFRHEKSFA